MILSHALDAVAVANELLQAKKEDGKSVLDYKKIKLAYSLGRVIDILSPYVSRFQKEREKLFDELGDKYVGFSSETEIKDAEELDLKLSTSQTKEHGGRFLYQLPADVFEKIDATTVKIIETRMHKIPRINEIPLNTAIDDLLSQEIDCNIRIPIEALDGVDLNGIVCTEQGMLKSQDDIIRIVLALHEIVEGI